jgi:hypothetical protein
MPIHEFLTNMAQPTPPETVAVTPTAHPDFRSDVQQLYPLIAQHNESNPDHQLVGGLSKEVLRVSGAEVKLFLRTENYDHDSVWGEDPDPTWWQPLLIRAFYEFPLLTVSAEAWGPDMNLSFDLFLSYQEVLEIVGPRMIRHGDVFRLPVNAVAPLPIRDFEVTSSSPFKQWHYQWVYWKCTVANISGDAKMRPDPTQPVVPGEY